MRGHNTIETYVVISHWNRDGSNEGSQHVFVEIPENYLELSLIPSLIWSSGLSLFLSSWHGIRIARCKDSLTHANSSSSDQPPHLPSLIKQTVYDFHTHHIPYFFSKHLSPINTLYCFLCKAELQIRGGIEDNSKIIFLIFH